jgi:hypothetical protein
MDFITNLPICNGFDSIFIMVDQGLSKGVILCPCNKTIDAEGTIKLYIDNVFIQYGLPDIIISDRGPQFASNIFNGIFDAIGVKPKQEGPFKIKEVLGPVTYQLTLPKQWKIHDVFHACLLMPYKETELHGPNETRPPPNLVQGNEEYEIETIVSHRLHKNCETMYLIKWKGYHSSENSWITESDLINAEEELNDYKRR